MDLMPILATQIEDVEVEEAHTSTGPSTPNFENEPVAPIVSISIETSKSPSSTVPESNSHPDTHDSIRSQIKKQAIQISPNEEERLEKLERARLHASNMQNKEESEESVYEDILRFIMLLQNGWSNWTAYIAVKVF